jgi:NADPH-dependent glutamate synthase beta subunit-like oxidoreductase
VHVGIQRSKKKKKKLGTLRGHGSGGSGVESSPLRPQGVEKTAACMGGCPQGTDIRGILTKIASGEKLERPREETFKEVFEMLTEKNPLPAVCGRVCPHPCEAECNRSEVDGAVAINNVERFVGDWGIEHGLPLAKATDEKREESVAVIGAGPAGLSCAYHLAREGYPVTIYEAFPKPGGMLRYGIPAYRLPREIIDAEVQRILDLGVDLECGVAVGRDVSMEEIRQKHRVVFVGIGAHKGRLLGCPGEDAENVWTGTEFLNKANRGEQIDVGKKVLVVGGGDTAVDAARVSRRMGAEVTIVYRRTRKEMPAIDEEVVGAEEEGIEMHFLAAPIEIVTDNGRGTAMRCQVMELGEPDDSGRRRPVPKEGEEFTLEADTVIAAISQEPDFTGLEDLKAGPRDWIKTDEIGATKEEGVFAGGDVLDLGLVTIAIYQGRLAAETVHRQLRGLPVEKPEDVPVLRHDKMALTYYEKMLRQECDALSPEERLSQPEVEIETGLTEEQAVAESLRCMSCGSCFDCGTCWSYCQDSAIVKPLRPGEPYKFKLELCNGCKKCWENCPCGYLEFYDPTGAVA